MSRRDTDDIIDGLRVLRIYDEECHVGARSDMIWGPAVKKEDMQEWDITVLEGGGWFINEQYGNWCKYCL